MYSLHLACATPPTTSTNINNIVPNTTRVEEDIATSRAGEEGSADSLAWQWQQMMAGMYGGNMVGEWGAGGYNMVNLGPTEIQQVW